MFVRFATSFLTLLAVGCGSKQSIVESGSATFLSAKTRALIVGVLEFQSPDFLSFPTDTRQDTVFRDELVRQGIPSENVTTVLDGEATLPNLKQTLATVIDQIQGDESLLLYFTGHGSAEVGNVFLSTYDGDRNDMQGTMWDPVEITQKLVENFRGRRLMMLGDFCNSGIFSEVAANVEKKRPDIEAWAFASAHRWAYSTGAWTFTETVTEALRGPSYADANADETVSMQEVASHVDRTMHIKEKQMASSYLSHRRSAVDSFQSVTYDSESVLPNTADESLELKQIHQVGSSVNVDWDGVNEPATVRDINGEYRSIEYHNPVQDWMEWIHVSRLR